MRVRLERPFRFALAFLAVALALTAVLLAGCGGGDDRAKVVRARSPTTPSPEVVCGRVPRLVEHDVVRARHPEHDGGPEAFLVDGAGEFSASAL